MVGCSVGRLVGGSVGGLVGGLVDGSVGGLVGVSVGGLVGVSVGGLVGGSVDESINGFGSAVLAEVLSLSVCLPISGKKNTSVKYLDINFWKVVYCSFVDSHRCLGETENEGKRSLKILITLSLTLRHHIPQDSSLQSY